MGVITRSFFLDPRQLFAALLAITLLLIGSVGELNFQP